MNLVKLSNYELERFYSEHGKPSIIQCEQGTEFKGKVEQMLDKTSIHLIKSRRLEQN